jgi:HEAT repeat protein
VSGVAGSAGSFTTDCSLVVQSWDRWLATATGIAEEEARGRSLAELFPDLEARGLLSRLRRVCEQGAVSVLAPAFHAYLLPCRPRAASVHFTHMQQHVTLAPLRAGDEVVGVLVTIEDVTGRRDHEHDIAAQLRSPDDAVRLRAVRTLASEGGASAPLVGALGDTNWRVRRAAAEVLAQRTDDASVEALLSAVRERHRDPATLNAALGALVHAGSDVVPPLLESFGHAAAEAELRTYLALALGLLEDPRAVPVLLAALDDEDANVRYHAIEALGRIRARASALAVAAVAEARDFSVAFAALDTLALIGEPSVTPRLVAVLDDELLHAAAAEALGQLGREDAVGPLAARLARPGYAVATLATALAALFARFDAAGNGALIADLARAVAGPDAGARVMEALAAAAVSERKGLLLVLSWLDPAGAEPLVVPLLEDPETRSIAADFLAHRRAQAVEPLLATLAGDDEEARKAAAATLGRIGAKAAVPPLLEMLAAPADVALVAASALGGIGDPAALDGLIECLDHPQAGVRRTAAAAIDSIGHPDLAQRVCGLLAHPSPRVREAVATVAGYFGFAECASALIACCDDADETVRRTAVEQLAYFDDARALKALTDALESGTPPVRAAAARSLAHAAVADAVPRLRVACRDSDPWVRYYAARSAGHHQRSELVPDLVALATGDATAPVRIAAVEALADIGAADAAAVLRPLASADDAMLARAALLALGRLGDSASLPVLLAALASGEPLRQLAALEAIACIRQELGPGTDEIVREVGALARTAHDGGVRERALQVLGRAAGASGVAAVIAIAESPRRAREVADALAALGEAQVSWVGHGLTHADASVRCVVVEALGRMEFSSAAALLATALGDEAPEVRFAAAQALGRRDVRAARSTSPGRG